MSAVRNSSALGPKSSISNRGGGRVEIGMLRDTPAFQFQERMSVTRIFVFPGAFLVLHMTQPCLSSYLLPKIYFSFKFCCSITYHYSHSLFFCTKSEELLYSKWSMFSPTLGSLSPLGPNLFFFFFDICDLFMSSAHFCVSSYLNVMNNWNICSVLSSVTFPIAPLQPFNVNTHAHMHTRTHTHTYSLCLFRVLYNQTTHCLWSSALSTESFGC